jgi:hypothetical protein
MYFSLDRCTPLFRERFIFSDMVYNHSAVFPWYINTQIGLKTGRSVVSIVWIMLHSFHMNDHVISDIPNQQCSIMLWVVVSWPWKVEPIQLYHSSPRFLSSIALANILHENRFVAWKDILKMPKGVIRSRRSKKDRHYCECTFIRWHQFSWFLQNVVEFVVSNTAGNSQWENGILWFMWTTKYTKIRAPARLIMISQHTR